MEPQTETTTSVAFEELVQNAKDIIAGRKPTQLMPEEPRVEHFMKWLDPDNRPRQETVDWFYLQCYYGGEHVLTFQVPPSKAYPEGHLVVLASGADVGPLLRRLTGAERRQLVIEFPPVCDLDPLPESQTREDVVKNSEGESREPAHSATPTDLLDSPAGNDGYIIVEDTRARLR